MFCVEGTAKVEVLRETEGVISDMLQHPYSATSLMVYGTFGSGAIISEKVA